MVNVLRPKTQLNYKDFTIHQRAADIKLMSSISKFLHEGNITTMANMKDMYRIIALLEYILSRYDETHLVFDTYRENSLKSLMRKKRTGKTQPVQFKINDSTYIGNTSMKLLLSHTKTKDELTAYLSEKAVQYAIERNKCLFVSWRETAKCSRAYSIDELKSNHEEADTKIILHSIFASRRGATQLHIYSPDTDVFVLALWWSKFFPLDTMFVTGIGQNQRMINLKNITNSLGEKKLQHC